MKLWRLGSVLIGLTLAFSACQLKDDSPASKDGGPPPIPAPADVAAPPAEAIKTPSGIASKTLIVGLGSIHPSLRSRVTVHYTGWTTDGKMFESSYQSPDGPARFLVGEVIPGWTEVLQLMVVGEKRRVWIPGPLAYDNIPGSRNPKGMLVFEIELLDIR